MGKGNRKLIALILSLVLCMTLLAGCGKSGQTSSESSDSNAASTDTASDSYAGNDASDSGKEITIKFPCIWVGTDGKAEVFGKMVESFNKENEGKIKVVIEENTDYDVMKTKSELLFLPETRRTFSLLSPMLTWNYILNQENYWILHPIWLILPGQIILFPV